jgi:hypothetical protein
VLLAVGIPAINVCFVGGLEDEPPATVEAVIVSVAGDGSDVTDDLHALADRWPTFLVVDDPTSARGGLDFFAAVVPTRDPMALLNATRNHFELVHDPVGPVIFCLCERRLPVLQASFDVRTHTAAVHCDRCGWVTSIEPLTRATPRVGA